MILLKFELNILFLTSFLSTFVPYAFSQGTSCNANEVSFYGTCLSSCPTSYYYESTTNQCERCSFGCATCTGFLGSQCTACHSNYVKSGSGCSCYPSGFFSITSQESNKTCASGYPLTTSASTRCYSCITSCAKGNYIDGINDYSCQPCSAGCQTCYSSGSSYCLGCSSSYYWNPYSRTCVSGTCSYNTVHPSFCANANCTSSEYFDTSVCNQICNYYQPLDITTPKGQCIACDYRCKSGCGYPNSNDYCFGCISGYYSVFQSLVIYNKSNAVSAMSKCTLSKSSNWVYSSLYGMQMQCLGHCSKCESTIEKCTKCSVKKYVTKDGGCIDYCPNTTSQVLSVSGVSFCYSKDDIDADAIETYNLATRYAIPIMNTLIQMAIPFTSSGFVRPIIFNLMLSIKYVSLDMSTVASFIIGNMSLITPTIVYPTPESFESNTVPYFWATFWPYLMNYCLLIPFMVSAYFLSKRLDNFKSKFGILFSKNYCDFFMINFPISFTLATMPDLILAMLREYREMNMSGRNVYFFYSLSFNFFYGFCVIAGWALVILPYVCGAHSAMKSQGKIPEKYNTMRVIYGDIKIETKRAMFFFFLFFVRAVGIVFVSIALEDNPGTCMLLRIIIGSIFTLLHPILRPYKSLLRAIEYFSYDIVALVFDVIGFMTTLDFSNLSTFENVDLRSLYAQITVACLYAMMSLQFIFGVAEVIKIFVKCEPKPRVQPAPRTEVDPALRTRDREWIQELPSGPSVTSAFRANQPPTAYNDPNGLALQESRPSSNEVLLRREPSIKRDTIKRDTVRRDTVRRDTARVEPMRVPNVVDDEEANAQNKPPEGSVMRDFSRGMKDTSKSHEQGSKRNDNNMPRDIE